jgi:hypothetical protein
VKRQLYQFATEMCMRERKSVIIYLAVEYRSDRNIWTSKDPTLERGMVRPIEKFRIPWVC